MKRYIILLLLIIISFSIKSQSFYGGLSAGFTISQVDGDGYGGYNKIAPAGGVYVRNTFRNPNWGASVGILYKNKGSRAVQKDDSETTREVYAIKLHYIEIPMLLNYKIEKINIPHLFSYSFKNDLYLEFGFSYSYLLKGTEYFDLVDYRTKDFKKYEIGMHIGLAYRLGNHWLLNYRFSYTFPFTPIHPHPGRQVYWLNRGMYNNNMNFSVIYEF